MLTDQQLLELNVFEEAYLEPDDGRAAIARIVKNRMARKFFSDGTISGTVLCRDQFSWAWFGFETVHTGTAVHDIAQKEYVQISFNLGDAQETAENLYDMAPASALAVCGTIAQQVMAGAYQGPLYDQLTDDAVLYCNPAILTKLPVWAIPSARVCSIGHHIFFRSVPVPAKEGLIA